MDFELPELPDVFKGQDSGTTGEFCEAYVDDAGTYHTSKHCPGPDAIGDALKNIYCCGSATYKYCCSKPTGYFLEHFK
nr:protein shisa-3 homolog [Lytechinus pictus]